VFKAHRLVYHSTLGLRVIKKKKTPSLIPYVRKGCGHGSMGRLAAVSNFDQPPYLILNNPVCAEGVRARQQGVVFGASASPSPAPN